MILIQAPRQTGKTTTLIHLSSVLDKRIITKTARQAQYIKELANKIRVPIPKPLPYSEVKFKRYNGNFLIYDLDNFYLDEVVEMVIEERVKIEYATCLNKTKAVKLANKLL